MKYYFGEETARKLGDQLDLDAEEYAAWVAPRVDDLEIKDRVGVFAQGLADRLADRLPADYPEALAHVVPRLGPELKEGEGYFNHSFHLWPVGRFIEDYGTTHPEESLAAIEALTRAFTGEWAIRPFLARYPELTLAHVRQWARSESHNVRRLASEGIRPRLPWASVHRPFMVDPTPVIEVLNLLYDDTSPYVRTSVSNNLNDIARTHPDLAVATAKRWIAEDDSPEVRHVAERGLRGLIKQSHPEALSAVGFAITEELLVSDIDFPQQVRIGQPATLRVRLVNGGEVERELLVDYRLHFLKKNGQRRPSVFRFGKYRLLPGEELEAAKTHRFTVTGTRTYYPGTQAVSVVVNGVESEVAEFELVGG